MVASLEVGFLAAFAVGLTCVAWWLHPAWDDGWLWLQRLEGDLSVQQSMADRPILGWLWASLGRAGLLLPLSAVAHGAGWLGLALVTRELWRRNFPVLRNFGFLAALLVLGSTLLEIQWVLINPVWSGVAVVALVYFALLTLESAIPARSRVARWGGYALVVTCLIVASLLSEYGVLAAVVVVVFVWVRGSSEPRGGGAMRWRAMVLILTPALTAYALFLAFADQSLRPNMRPEQLLNMGGEYLLALPFIVLTELWQGVAGNLLWRVGAIEVESIQSLLVALASGLSALVAYGLLPGASSMEAIEEGRRRREVWTLLAAGALGLVAMTAAGKVPWSGVTTRYYLPVAPLLSCLTLWAVLKLTRSRFRRILGGALAFVVLFSTMGDARSLLVERQRVASLAPEIAPHLDPDGFNLVVLLQPEANAMQRRAAGYELTARIAEGLDEAFHRRIWVLRYEAREEEGLTGPQLIGKWEQLPVLTRSLRGFAGRKEVTRVVWLELDKETLPQRIAVASEDG